MEQEEPLLGFHQEESGQEVVEGDLLQVHRLLQMKGGEGVRSWEAVVPLLVQPQEEVEGCYPQLVQILRWEEVEGYQFPPLLRKFLNQMMEGGGVLKVVPEFHLPNQEVVEMGQAL